MPTQIELGDIKAEISFKDIKNLHLSVHPPNGRVRISAPLRMSPETIRVFAISRLSWIKQQQEKIRAQERETPREYLDLESHYLWGKRYLLKVIEENARSDVELTHGQIILKVHPGTDESGRHNIVEQWYRDQLKEAVSPLIAKWEPLLNVKVQQIFVQRMKTRWGSCNPASRNIRLNTDLAKKPPECLEYILVHEMMHLVEPTHNTRFLSLMDTFMPKWKFYRENLNRLPVRHEHWIY